MKGKDIITAVECCVQGLKYCPEECPMWDNGIFLKHKCRYNLLRAVLELIDRLKAERNKYKIKAQYQKGELARLNKQVVEQKAEIEENNLKIGHQAQIIRTLETALDNKMAEIEMKEALIAMWCDMWKDQKAELSKKDTEIDILIRKKEALSDEISELQHKIASCNAEIEDLKVGGITDEQLKRVLSEYDISADNLKKAKTEAIKEFAQRLKKHCYFDHKDQRNVVAEVIVDHYVKEMTEVEK